MRILKQCWLRFTFHFSMQNRWKSFCARSNGFERKVMNSSFHPFQQQREVYREPIIGGEAVVGSVFEVYFGRKSIPKFIFNVLNPSLRFPTRIEPKPDWYTTIGRFMRGELLPRPEESDAQVRPILPAWTGILGGWSKGKRGIRYKHGPTAVSVSLKNHWALLPKN